MKEKLNSLILIGIGATFSLVAAIAFVADPNLGGEDLAAFFVAGLIGVAVGAIGIYLFLFDKPMKRPTESESDPDVLPYFGLPIIDRTGFTFVFFATVEAGCCVLNFVSQNKFKTRCVVDCIIEIGASRRNVDFEIQGSGVTHCRVPVAVPLREQGLSSYVSFFARDEFPDGIGDLARDVKPKPGGHGAAIVAAALAGVVVIPAESNHCHLDLTWPSGVRAIDAPDDPAMSQTCRWYTAAELQVLLIDGMQAYCREMLTQTHHGDEQELST